MSVCHLQTWPCVDMMICRVSQLKCRLRTTVTIHCERVCLAAYKMGVVAVETDRATSSGRLRPNTPPPARALTPATRPSDPGGRSAGKKGGKWALLLVCDLCGEVRQTSSLVVSLPLRISEHTSHFVSCGLVRAQFPPFTGGGGQSQMPYLNPENSVADLFLNLFFRCCLY